MSMSLVPELTLFSDAALRISSAGTLKATAFFICATALQRLHCDARSVCCYMGFRVQKMVHRQYTLQVSTLIHNQITC